MEISAKYNVGRIKPEYLFLLKLIINEIIANPKYFIILQYDF